MAHYNWLYQMRDIKFQIKEWQYNQQDQLLLEIEILDFQ
jgi:hypothetical protein